MRDKIIFSTVLLIVAMTQISAFCNNEVKVELNGITYSLGSNYYGEDFGEVISLSPNLINVEIRDMIEYEGQSYPVEVIDLKEIDNKVMTSISIPVSISKIKVYNDNDPFPKCLKVVNIKNIVEWCKVKFPGISEEIIPPTPMIPGSGSYNRPKLNDYLRMCPLDRPDAELYLNGELVKDLIIPDGVTELGRLVFYGNKFNSITLPASVSEIGGLALTPYKGWTINEVHAADMKSWCSIYYRDFYIYDYNEYYYFSSLLKKGTKLYIDGKFIEGELSFPDDITGIGGHAFQHYSYITSVTIGPNIKSIGPWAFEGCENLLTLRYEEGVTEIAGLSSPSHDGWPTRDEYGRVIEGTYYIKTLYLPSTLTSMLSYYYPGGFSEADNLETIVIAATVPPVIGEDTFGSKTYKEGTLYVPEGTAELYRNAKYWKNFKHITEEKFDDIKVVEDSMSEGIDYSQPYDVYSVSGMRIGCSYDELPAGIYIIRQNGKSRKIVIN